MKQVEPITSWPWRIVEMYHTSDGLRTRITEGNWEFETEARDEIKRREEAARART